MSNLPILFEDNTLLVVNKPSGVIVNRSDTTKEIKTLQDLVEDYLHINSTHSTSFHSDASERAGQESKIQNSQNWESPEEAFIRRSGIVHRLDKETSGILLIAKTLPAFIELQRQFKERIVEKSYLALAHGKIVPNEGEIRVPVGRLSFNRKRFGVVAGGREAVTRYRVISNLKLQIPNSKTEFFSFVELYPKTGRTHQIRVHLQYIGHPIFGDELYAGRKQSREDRKILPRVFLHAASISFLHPISGKRVEWKAPLPNELQKLLPA